MTIVESDAESDKTKKVVVSQRVLSEHSRTISQVTHVPIWNRYPSTGMLSLHWAVRCLHTRSLVAETRGR